MSNKATIFTVTATDRLQEPHFEGGYKVKPFSFKKDEFFMGFSGGDNGIVNLHTDWSFNEIVKDFLPQTVSTEGLGLPFRYHVHPVLKDWDDAGKKDVAEMVAIIASLIAEQPNGEDGQLAGEYFCNRFLCSSNGRLIWIKIVYGSYDKSKPLWKWYASYGCKPRRYSLPGPWGHSWD